MKIHGDCNRNAILCNPPAQIVSIYRILRIIAHQIINFIAILLHFPVRLSNATAAVHVFVVCLCVILKGNGIGSIIENSVHIKLLNWKHIKTNELPGPTGNQTTAWKYFPEGVCEKH